MSKKERYRFLHRESRRWEQWCVNIEYSHPSAEAWAGLMLRNYGRWALEYALSMAKHKRRDDHNYYAQCVPILEAFFS
jgi:hypothetical protein